MFCFVFGLPGGFAEWCEAVVIEAARLAGEPAELIRGDTLEEIALNAIGTRAANTVVASRQPGGRLAAAVVDSGRNFVVALDDPRTALIDLVVGRGIGFADAVQTLASSCAALIGIADAPRALVIYGGRDWPHRAATASAVARHLQLPIDEQCLTELAARAAIGDVMPPGYDAAAWWSGLDPAEQQLAIGAMAPFVEGPADGLPLSITWGRELFFLGERPDQRVSGPVDVTGRARCLLHGPHIILPPGMWSLSLTVRLTRGAGEHEFLAEIHADRRLAGAMFRPQRDDSAAITLDFVLDPATEQPVALRISSQRAAFDGAIDVVGATLVRAAPPA